VKANVPPCENKSISKLSGQVGLKPCPYIWRSAPRKTFEILLFSQGDSRGDASNSQMGMGEYYGNPFARQLAPAQARFAKIMGEAQRVIISPLHKRGIFILKTWEQWSGGSRQTLATNMIKEWGGYTGVNVVVPIFQIGSRAGRGLLMKSMELRYHEATGKRFDECRRVIEFEAGGACANGDGGPGVYVHALLNRFPCGARFAKEENPRPADTPFSKGGIYVGAIGARRLQKNYLAANANMKHYVNEADIIGSRAGRGLLKEWVELCEGKKLNPAINNKGVA